MKNLLSMTTLALTLGCSTYSIGELNGKWTHPSKPLELWISDTLAIGFEFENQFLLLYHVDYSENVLTFICIEPYAGSSWKDKIIDLTENEMELELQNPGNRERRRYQRLTNELPEISTDFETNYRRYESYLQSKLDHFK